MDESVLSRKVIDFRRKEYCVIHSPSERFKTDIIGIRLKRSGLKTRFSGITPVNMDSPSDLSGLRSLI